MLAEFLLSEIHKLRQNVSLPLHRQLYEALRNALLSGKLAPGAQLPSSRELSADLGLSRNTVIAALNQLSVEGYIVSALGSGTYVSDNLPRYGPSQYGKQRYPALDVSNRGNGLVNQFSASHLEVQPFPPGIADFSAFPLTLWQRLQNKHWRMTYPDMLDYASTGGYAPLKRAIANYLRISRSLDLDASQVIVTNGTQQSLLLCSLMLANAGDTVWVEDPAYWGAVKAFMASDLTIAPIAVDEEGMQTHTQSPEALNAPKLIYLTPSHQYPTGVVMSLARRKAILDAAKLHQAWVLEDDYDSEFRFSGAPLSSIEGLDRDERVIYMGTFSKVLYPGIKMGYLIVPKHIVQHFQKVHYELNRPGQLPLQAALAEFMEAGHFANALRRTKQTYALRRSILLEALSPCMQLGAQVSGAEQGLHLCLRLPAGVDDVQLVKQLATQGITVRALSQYCLARKDLRGLIIGYGYANLKGIEKYSPLLAQTILQALQR